ncbi:MAG: PilZ domain-containing protein [Candidatus Hydrogenedentes bacterium]|nr:PilZ domain-containing protein [Candidatus Hydrogenedentota bacterium]
MDSLSHREEHRTDTRTAVRLDVLWSTDVLTGNDGPVEAVVTDLSNSGARLLCSRYLPEFTRISLTFSTGEHSFTCQGSVVWCATLGEHAPGSYAAGIEFQGIDSALRTRLNNLLSRPEK